MSIATSSVRNKYEKLVDFTKRTLAWGGDDLAVTASPTEWYPVWGSNVFQFHIAPETSITSYDINVYILHDGDWFELTGEAGTHTSSYSRELSIVCKQVYVRISGALGGGAGTDNIHMYAGAK